MIFVAATPSDFTSVRGSISTLSYHPQNAFGSQLVECGNLLGACEGYLTCHHVRSDGDGAFIGLLKDFSRDGIAAFSTLLSDAAVVVWDARTRTLTAATDPFAARPLYFCQTRDRLFVSTSMAPLEPHSRMYDREFLACRLVEVPLEGHTAWMGISQIPAAHALTYRDGVIRVERYWHPERFCDAQCVDSDELPSQFRAQLTKAIALAGGTSKDRRIWVQLSGGVDSTALAVALRDVSDFSSRVAGCVTFADDCGLREDGRCSSIVARQIGATHEVIRDFWAWQNSADITPPRTTTPFVSYPFYTAHGRLYRRLTEYGAQTLLNGTGPDHYMPTKLFLVDLIRDGHIGRAIRGLRLLASAASVSVFRIAVNHFCDALPLSVQVWRTPAASFMPRWLRPKAIADFGLLERVQSVVLAPRRTGTRLGDIVVSRLGQIPDLLEHWSDSFSSGISTQYPYLYRPLVEVALQALRYTPTPPQYKWLLKRAVYDLLPAEVSRRRVKGDAQRTWLVSLSKEEVRLRRLLSASELESLGLVDVAGLSAEFDNAKNGKVLTVSCLFSAMALETWLGVNSGRWQSGA